MSLSAEAGDVFEDEHQAADLVDQLGIFLRQAVEQRPLGRPVGDVEHLGHRLDAAGVLEALAHHARHPALEALFHLADDLRVRAAHRGDAADHGQPPRLGQAGQNFRRRSLAGKCDMISAIVCGCSSMMYVSRFWLSTCRRKPNGMASIDWRMLLSAAVAFVPSAF